MMSHPPKNSPSRYTWGKVGQSEYTFMPARKPSSSRMSTVSNGTSMDLNTCTTVLENPQRGCSLLPFMNTTILFEETNLSIADFISGPMFVTTSPARRGAADARARGARPTARPRTAVTQEREEASAAMVFGIWVRETRLRE